MKRCNIIISEILSKPTQITVTAVVATMAVVSFNADANNTLTTMSSTQVTNQITQLRLDFNEVPPTPRAYQLDHPKRLVLDLSEVTNALPNQFNAINQGAISEVTSLDKEESTRLIIGLNGISDKNFATTIEGKSLLVDIIDTNKSLESTYNSTSLLPTVILPSTSTSAPKTDRTVLGADTMIVRVNPLLNPNQASQGLQTFSYDGVTGVDYVDNSDGGGSITIGLVNESTPVDIQRQGNEIVVRITSALVPLNLKRQQTISGSLVSNVSARNSGKNGVVTIAMSDDFEYKAYQTGNSIHIEVVPHKLLIEPTLEGKKYSGKPISLDFQNVEVRSILHLLSQFTEMNIVASDNVTGSITLNLINVPWDQALDIILISKNLGMRTNGNVILIAPANTLADQEAKELEAQRLVKDLSPLHTEYIRLSYAKAKNVLKLISEGFNTKHNSNDTNLESSSLLSSRGTVTIDSRTNTLIIKDSSESIANIRALIKKIDIPVRQVMIEARIVKATDNFSKEIGVKWGILSTEAANNRNLLISGNDQTLWDLKQVKFEGETNKEQKLSYTIKQPSNLNVDLGVDNGVGRIAFGLLNMSDLMIDLELSAMQADGRGEVISTPKVLTMDKQKARVSSGTQIPYLEASASGATSTAFVEAALSLEVTPNIMPDGKISLELIVENGSPQTYNGAVAISKDSIMTNVLVEDGQTIVLGGIFRNRISEGVQKVPFLGDLPYIGKLFRNDIRSNNKDELLIFVTPRLLAEGVSRIN